jgi:hypothetical protein
MALTEHLRRAAAQAWYQLFPNAAKLNSVEPLQERGKSGYYVYRLHCRELNTAIAKRCETHRANLEQDIYQNVLPHVPISSLRFYGRIDEPTTQCSWIFLEDAGDQAFTYSDGKHRILATRWLGRMHISGAGLSAVSRLRERGPGFYLQHLQRTRALIQNILVRPSAERYDLETLESILLRGLFLESRWDRVEELCHRFPRTLVHGDFAKRNVRLRAHGSEIDFVGFDWGKAGYGIPAVDIKAASGDGMRSTSIETDLADYWSVVGQSWPALDFVAIKQLADLGGLFRCLHAISWTIENIGRANWEMKYLPGYDTNLSTAIECLGIAR